MIPMFINTLENAFSNICIYGNSEETKMVYEYLLSNKNINVELLVKDEMLSCLSKEIELVLFMENNHSVPYYQDGREVYFIDYYEMKKHNFSNPLKDIFDNIVPKLLNNNVRVIFIGYPSIKDIFKLNKSFLFLFYQCIFFIRRKNKRLWLNTKCRKELRQEYIEIKNDNKKGYIRSWHNGKNINFDDGFRRIYRDNELTENAKNVYIYGYCVSANANLSDKETIGAFLQKELGANYNVLSRSNDCSANNLIMREQKYEQGDIVCINISRNDQRIQEVNAEFIDLIDIYIKEPKVWKHMLESSMHIDAFFTNKIAEIMSDRIKEIKIEHISNSGIYFGNKKKKAPDLCMYNDNGLEEYVDLLKMDKQQSGIRGSIVMNCNPFTLGHKYLIEEALKQVDYLYVFVVSEDKSKFKFNDRFQMVKLGTEEYKNVFVFPTSTYMISATTVPGYFDKSNLGDISFSASYDLELFASICKEIGVSIRFAGEEPNDKFTNSYNKIMEEKLPEYGIEFKTIKRKCISPNSNIIISATTVRQLIEKGDWNSLTDFIPETTLIYLKNLYGESKYCI